MIGDISSGPRALELLLFLIASWTCSAVTVIVQSLTFCLTLLERCLKFLLGLVVAPGVYCSFNLDAIFL